MTSAIDKVKDVGETGHMVSKPGASVTVRETTLSTAAVESLTVNFRVIKWNNALLPSERSLKKGMKVPR